MIELFHLIHLLVIAVTITLGVAVGAGVALLLLLISFMLGLRHWFAQMFRMVISEMEEKTR